MNHYQSNSFPRHGHGYFPRRPVEGTGEFPNGNYNNNNHAYTRGPPPLYRFLRIPFLSNGQDHRQRQRFQPFIRPDKQWNTVGSRRRHASSANVPVPIQIPRNIAIPPHEVFNKRSRTLMPNLDNGKSFQPEYVLRNEVRLTNEDYCRRVSGQFTEVRASLNLTIRAQRYEMHREERCGTGRDLTTAKTTTTTSTTITFAGEDEGAVAVESELHFSPSSTTSEDIIDKKVDVCPDENNEVAQIEIPLVEEYQPENPDIKCAPHALYSTALYTSICSVDNSHQSPQMASCDDEGFHEAFVGVCISRYPSQLGRMKEVAGYGVWFSDGNKGNFSGVLQPDRPQNIKAVMIHGSARCIDVMKKKDYSRIRINLETEYLNENVLVWISKYMDNPQAKPSNWDELKYNPEILELCNAAAGMIIKWSHCCDTSLKKDGIEKAKRLARRATDAWMKEMLHLQEAVGTTPNQNLENDEKP